jgi:glyceraldehyde 3-phosphate dehydrogenase
MALRVAINGFGRIGRQVLQAGIHNPKIEWVAVNDLTDTKTLAHLLKYDSVYGIAADDIKAKESSIVIDGTEVRVLSEKDPAKLPWGKLDIDVVVESTGKFASGEEAKVHLKAGADKVLISAPAEGTDITLVKGVNDHVYDKKKHKIISNASCTTNCLAPMVKILNDAYRIQKGYMLTVHAYTADQRLVDSPHKDLRRARSAAVSLIPTTTGAARTVGEVIPSLKGKLDGMAVRAPVPCGSIATFTAQLEKSVAVDQVNALFKKAGDSILKGILQYSEEPLVSHDILRNPHSCIFDAPSTSVLGGNLVTVSGWYDNEWGYSSRIVDVLKLLK